MTSPTIQIQYDDLEESAQRFMVQADEIDALRKSLLRRVSELEQYGWKGRGSEAFFAEMRDEILPALRRLIEALEDGSETTRRIMLVFSQAEEEAQDRFDNLAPVPLRVTPPPAENHGHYT